MQLQCGGNLNIGGNSWQKTSIDRTRQDQGSQRMENANKNQRSGKLLKICEFLLEIHPELQSYSKAIKQPERKEKMEMRRRISTGFPEVKKQDYKSTGTFSSEKRRKI